MSEDISPTLSRFLNEAAWERLAEKLRLSPREIQVVQGVMEDETELAIARRLRMSPHTVHTHMDRLHGKLSVRGRPELIMKVLTTFLLMTAEPGSPLAPICGNRASCRCPLNG